MVLVVDWRLFLVQEREANKIPSAKDNGINFDELSILKNHAIFNDLFDVVLHADGAQANTMQKILMDSDVGFGETMLRSQSPIMHVTLQAERTPKTSEIQNWQERRKPYRDRFFDIAYLVSKVSQSKK